MQGERLWCVYFWKHILLAPFTQGELGACEYSINSWHTGGKRMTQTVALTVVLTQYFSLSNVSWDYSVVIPWGCFVCVIPGNLIPRHQELFYKNPLFAGMRLPEVKEAESLDKRYPKLSAAVLDLAKVINWWFTMNIFLFTCPLPWGSEYSLQKGCGC